MDILRLADGVVLEVVVVEWLDDDAVSILATAAEGSLRSVKQKSNSK